MKIRENNKKLLKVDISEAFPETNQTQENITIETNNSTENSQISNESVTAQPSGSNISKNISVINQTITENLTISEINQTISGENFSLNENIIQYGAKLGEPVKWKKTLKIDAEENKIINNLEVTLPKTAGNVSVVKIFANESVEELEVNVKNEKIISETEPTIFPQGMTPVSLITGQSVKNQEKKNILSKIFKFFKNFFVLVGKVVDIGENENAVLVNIQEELE
ncbi:hypothetical protein HYT91_03320, partial [Candidatus Pacearchaeota archaeon]|nr:hypothetical protein [Candidatus Pacearchaeota archaeon]